MSTQFLILSAERPDNSVGLNAAQTLRLKRALTARGLKFKPVQGAYNGVVEHSVQVLSTTNVDDYRFILKLARDLAQESILQVDDAGVVHLVFLRPNDDGHSIDSIKVLGHWTEIHAIENVTSWTKIAGKYYTAVQRPVNERDLSDV